MPRANAYTERFVLITRAEVTGPILIFSERHLRSGLAGYQTAPTTTDGDPTAAACSTARPPSGCPFRGGSSGGRSLAA
jgi:hypothetical protein